MLDLDSVYKDQQAPSNGGLNLDDVYNGSQNELNLDSVFNGNASSASNVNLDAIEHIESKGNNNAVSKSGAKGLYQFMPDTAYEYSKRLFGVGTRDASSLTPEQQQEMANAYFNDLLKEFHGNVNEAVAAYNAGQGNIEKDIQKAKEHGGDWLAYAKPETQNYVAQYDDLTGTPGYHTKKHNAFDGFMSGAIDEMNKEGNKIRHWLHMDDEGSTEATKEVEERTSEDAKDSPLAVAAGKVVGYAVPAMSAYGAGAGVVAPMMEGEAAIPTFLATQGAGSVLSQLFMNGDVTAKNTGMDLITAGAFEGVGKFLTAPAIKQIQNALTKFTLAGELTPEVATATREYLGAARAESLGNVWKELREVPDTRDATLLDALEEMKNQVPDQFKSEAANAEFNKLLEGEDINGSHSRFIDTMRNLKQERYSIAKDLAKTDADQRLINTINEAVKSSKGAAFIPDNVMKSTPLQKVGEKAADWFGVNLPKSMKAKVSAEQLKGEADEVKDLLRRDNRRIGRELKKAGKNSKGYANTQHIEALKKQRTLNNRMIQFIDDGMNGKKVKVSDIAQAIKDVHEDQFNRGKFKGVTKRFKELADKMDVMSVHKLQKDVKIPKQIINHVAKKTFYHVIAKILGVSSVGITTASTIAGKVAKMAKASNLKFAANMAEMVKTGEITEAQANKLIEAKAMESARTIEKVAVTGREYFQK